MRPPRTAEACQTIRLVVVLLSLLAVGLQAQVVSNNIINGPTPPELAPSGPDRVYALSGLDRINLYNGHMSAAVPVLQVGGRGDSGYTITVKASNPPWTMENNASYNGTAQNWVFTSTPTAQSWHPYQTYYSPGFLVIKRTFQNFGQCPGGSGQPFAYLTSFTHLVFLAPDGSETVLYSTSNNGIFQNCPTELSRGDTFQSQDGSAMWFKSNASVSWCSNPPGITSTIYDRYDDSLTEADVPSTLLCGTLYLKNGLQYRIDAGRVRQIVDRNGNRTQLTYCGELEGSTCGGLDLLVEQIQDSVGRKVTVNYQGCGQDCHTLTYKGYGGASRTISILWGGAAARLRPGHSAETIFPEAGQTPLNQTSNSPYSITLNNNRAYSFYYNSYGELARIVLPTGGALDYEYAAGLSNAPATGVYASGQVLDALQYATNGDSNPPWQPFVYRRLQKRRQYLSDPGSTPPAQLDGLADGITTYTTAETATGPTYFSGGSRINGMTTWSSGGPVTVTTTGSGSVAVTREHTFSEGAYDTGSSFGVITRPGRPALALSVHPVGPGVPNPLTGSEIKQEVAGLETVRKVYTYDLLEGNPHVCQEQTTRGAVTSQRIFAYGSYDNLTDTYEYAFGLGPAINDQTSGSITYALCPTDTSGFARRTHTDYVTGSSYISALETSPPAMAVYLPSLVSATQVFGPAGLAAQTTYEYDIYSGTNHAALTPRSSLSGHESGFGTGHTFRGNVTAVSRWLNTTGGSLSTYLQYDIAGSPVKRLDARGNATEYDYSDRFGSPNGDARDNSAPSELSAQSSFAFPTLVTNVISQTAYTQYDYYTGKPADLEDLNGVVTSAAYNDPLDRLTQMIRAAKKQPEGTDLSEKVQSTFAYDDVSRTVTTTSDKDTFNDNLLKQRAVYDGLGRTSETRQYTDSTNYIGTQTIYDALGRVSQVSNPGDTGNWTVTSYDPLGRVSTVTQPGGAVTRYDYSGDQTTVKDPACKVRTSTIDALGRLTQVLEDPPLASSEPCYTSYPHEYANYSTSYGYNTLDNLTGVTQGAQTRTFVYDSLSRLTSATNPESGNIGYTYDPNGNLLTKTDARNVTATLAYDALNRVTGKTFSDSTPAVSYEYDQDRRLTGDTNPNYPKGRLTEVNSSASTTTYNRFDALGRVVSNVQSIDSQTYRFGYSSNLAGALTSQAYPSSFASPPGRTVSLGYDGAGRLNSVSGYASSILYAAHGAVSQMQLGNSRWERSTFNNRLQPTEIGLGTASDNSNLLKLTFDYGMAANNGNVLGQTVQVPGFLTMPQSYAYDGVNRLQSASEPENWSETYGYDRYGNRWVSNSSGIFQRAVTPVANWFSGGNNRIDGNSYDAAGNQTGAGGGTFTFDAENRMTSVTLNSPQSGTFNYVYDGDGRRVKKTVYGMNSVYVYNATGQLAAEYRDGALFKEFVYAGGKLLAMEDPHQGTSYITTDHLGSTRVVTDAAGNVHSRHDYLPFGKEIDASLGNRSTVTGYGAAERVLQRFTGKEVDPETGLDYFIARYYSGAQGRFTTPDEFTGGIVDPFTGQQVGEPGPLPYADITDPQTLHKYAYVRNNPLRYTDPDGHAIDTLLDIGFIAYDVYKIVTEGATRTNVAALGADVAGALLPFVTGGGLAVRAGVKGVDGAGDLKKGAELLIDSNVIVTDGKRLVESGQNIVKADVALPELRNAVANPNSRLTGVPKAADVIPTVAGAKNVNSRINVRGQLPAGPGRFGDGVTGATAIERGSTLVTQDKKLRKAVEKLGGKVKKPEDIP